MIYINVVDKNPIVLECHKYKEDGEIFRLVIDPITKELIERPEKMGIDEGCAYSHIYGFLLRGEPIPDKTVSAWG